MTPLGLGSGIEKIGGKDDGHHGSVPNVCLTDPRLKEAGIDPRTLIGKGITEEQLQEKLQRKREIDAAAKANKEAASIKRRR